MAKKRTHKTSSSASSTSKRMPPQVPKCVKKDAKLGGYVTDFVTFENAEIRFLLKKLPEGYSTYKITKTGTKWISMTSEALSPSTRQHFRPQTTLTKAIANLEEYLQFKLPDVR